MATATTATAMAITEGTREIIREELWDLIVDFNSDPDGPPPLARSESSVGDDVPDFSEDEDPWEDGNPVRGHPHAPAPEHPPTQTERSGEATGDDEGSGTSSDIEFMRIINQMRNINQHRQRASQILIDRLREARTDDRALQRQVFRIREDPLTRMRTYFWQDADVYGDEANASDETPTDTGAASSTSLESSTPVWRAPRRTRTAFAGETMDEWIARQNLRLTMRVRSRTQVSRTLWRNPRLRSSRKHLMLNRQWELLQLRPLQKALRSPKLGFQ